MENNPKPVRISDKPVINPAERAKYMFFIDKEGFLAKCEYKTRKLTDAEVKAREAAKKKKAEDRAKKLAESAKKQQRIIDEKVKRAQDRVKALQEKKEKIGA